MAFAVGEVTEKLNVSQYAGAAVRFNRYFDIKKNQKNPILGISAARDEGVEPTPSAPEGVVRQIRKQPRPSKIVRGRASPRSWTIAPGNQTSTIVRRLLQTIGPLYTSSLHQASSPSG